MFKLVIGSAFEFAVECGGVFLRVGRREFFASREEGFVSGRTG